MEKKELYAISRWHTCKKAGKRVMTLLLALVVMISCLIPAEVYAADVKVGGVEQEVKARAAVPKDGEAFAGKEEYEVVDGIIYEYYERGYHGDNNKSYGKGKAYVVCGLTKDCPEDVVIASEINGKPVSIIDDELFYDYTGIKSITIPSSVRAIGRYAFAGCTNLTEVNLSEGLQYIGQGAFQASGIKKITIPSTLQYAGAWPFSLCDNLTSVAIADGASEIDGGLFARCSSLTDVEIPNTVTKINGSAFCKCSSLKSITIPESVTSICPNAFKECTNLSDVYYEGSKEQWSRVLIESGNDSLTSAKIHYTLTAGTGDTVASGKNNYEVTAPGLSGSNGTVTYTGTSAGGTSVKIPATVTVDGVKYKVTAVAESAFKGNTKLTTVTIGKNVTSIGSQAFANCASLKTVTFAGGSGLKSIGSSAFKNCKKLTKITIPNTVTKIGASAFSGCAALKTVSFASGSKLKSIGSSAFKNCKKLTKITVPNKVTSIGASAFSGCTALKTVTLGTGITKIEKQAFYGCRKLTTVTIKSKKLKTVGSKAFKGISSTAQIKVPSAKLSSYKKILKGKGQGSRVKITKI